MHSRSILHQDKKLKIEQSEDCLKKKEAIKVEWEAQKQKLLQEMEANKAAEQQLQNQVRHLQDALDQEKAQWELKIEEMKVKVDEANRSKLDAVQAAKNEMAAASDQAQQVLKQRLLQEEEVSY